MTYTFLDYENYFFSKNYIKAKESGIFLLNTILTYNQKNLKLNTEIKNLIEKLKIIDNEKEYHKVLVEVKKALYTHLHF